MFKRVTCPTCNYKFNIPEADMLKLHSCPNCQTPFRAGKSESEPVVASSQAAAAPSHAAHGSAHASGDPTLDKTMLTGAQVQAPPQPPICFNCPRCQKPLELPASEVGTKRPCPHCSQRLLVPDAPPAAPGLDKTMLAGGTKNGPHANIAPARDPALDKTMLASDKAPIRFDCPRCQKPIEVPAGAAGTKLACPSCSQRVMVPTGDAASASQPAHAHTHATTPGQPATGAAPWPVNLSPRTLIILAVAAGILLLIVLIQVLAPSHDRAAFAQANANLEKLKKEMKENELKQERIKAELRRDEVNRKQNEKSQRRIDKLGEDYLQLASNVRRQKDKLDEQYDKLPDIVEEGLRLQTKAKLDRQKAELKREERRIKEQQEEVRKQKLAEQEAQRRREQEHADRLAHERRLREQQLQQQQAMNLAIINANRPSYYPWSWRHWAPW